MNQIVSIFVRGMKWIIIRMHVNVESFLSTIVVSTAQYNN